jgi:hypothetical protein
MQIVKKLFVIANWVILRAKKSLPNSLSSYECPIFPTPEGKFLVRDQLSG